MKMTLADGTVIDNLVLNGNNYISQKELTEDMFDGNLGIVTIDDEETETTRTLKNCELYCLRQYGEEWWFVLNELTPEQAKANTTDAQVLYTALMTDTLLEEEEE